MTDRLSKADWIRHGLRTLASDGTNALKVVPLARKLGVSRGSFYWHFRDITDFRAQLLREWQERGTDQVIREIDSAKAGPDRLQNLMTRAFSTKRNLDRAMRSWGAEDRSVARVVASVDAKRVAYIAKLLTTAGVQRQRALDRANFLYWAYLGQTIVMDPRHASIAPAIVEDISALFEK